MIEPANAPAPPARSRTRRRDAALPIALAAALLLAARAGASPEPPRTDPPASRVIRPEELRRSLAQARAAGALSQRLALRSGESVELVGDVVVLRVRACPTCAVELVDQVRGLDVYRFTFDGSVLLQQLLGEVGDRWETPVFFTRFTTVDVYGAFYAPVMNDVSGIGLPLFNLREAFGVPADGVVRGYISMNQWWNCELMLALYPYGWSCAAEPPYFTSRNSLHGVLAQEVGHAWGAFQSFVDPVSGLASGETLGRGSAHWSYWLDTDGSPMEGNDWSDAGDGWFTLQPTLHARFSDLDLYAMGALQPEEVRPSFLIRRPDPDHVACDREPYCGPATRPEAGPRRVRGTRVDLTIDDVVAANGPRAPAYETAPRRTSQLFVFAVLDTDESELAADVAIVEQIRRYWSGYFYEAARHRMRAITTVSGRDDLARWEFAAEAEGFATSGADAAVVDGALTLVAHGNGAELAIEHDGLELAADGYRRAELRLAASPGLVGKPLVLAFGPTTGGLRAGDSYTLAPVADGGFHVLEVELRANPGWSGTVGRLRLSLEGAAAGDSLAIDRIAFTASSDATGGGDPEEEVLDYRSADDDPGGCGCGAAGGDPATSLLLAAWLLRRAARKLALAG